MAQTVCFVAIYASFNEFSFCFYTHTTHITNRTNRRRSLTNSHCQATVAHLLTLHFIMLLTAGANVILSMFEDEDLLQYEYFI